MKKFGIYVLGMITGIALLQIVSVIFSRSGDVTEKDVVSEEIENSYHIRDLQMLPQKGKCITYSDLEIFQTISKGVALAAPQESLDKILLLVDDNGGLFYDGEKIKMPSKKCAKQIGVYTYRTTKNMQKTVPAVVIE